MDVTTAATVAGGVAAVLVPLGIVARLLIKVLKSLRQIQEDYFGEPARPGYDRRKGIPERLQDIERILTANGGSSMRDAINRVELSQNRQMIDQAMLAKRLDDHLQQSAVLASELLGVKRQLGSADEQQPPAAV